MTLYEFKNPRFVKTAIEPKDYPVLRDLSGEILPEIAVAGRSNVGKSSLLNNLFASKGLVKTSSTPGKTQAINFFTLNQKLAFVDLPGYGYAKVSHSVRKQWGPMVEAYFEKRESLQLMLFLFDIRRMPNEDDFELLNWILHSQKAMILVLTKVDKVTQSERAINTKKILDALNLENLHYVHYSVPKNHGRKQLVALINEALTPESPDETP
jgi:GTP-binding protein